MNLTLYFGIILYMYLTTTVAVQVGVMQVGTASSLVVVVLALDNIFRLNKVQLFATFKEEVAVFFVAIWILLLKLITGDFNGIGNVIFLLMVPVMVAVLLQTKDSLIKKNIARLVLIFFITECLLAIYERAFLLNLFPDINDLPVDIPLELLDDLGFRSSAFLGHPLENALCVSTIMGFILTTNMKHLHKFFFVGMGYIALLSFNAKGALLVWTILLVIFLLNAVLNKRIKDLTTPPIIIFFLFAIYGLYELIVSQNYGDRFFQEDLMDGSAMTRFEVFDAFSYVDGADFWLGNSSSYDVVMNRLGAGGVENSYIVAILNYGIVMAIVLFVSLIFWVKRLLKPYTLFNKFIILTSFVVVGSLNNSLASSTSWVFFTLCASTFLFINQPQIEIHKNAILNLHKSHYNR